MEQNINIIYENKDAVICVKPAGLISETGEGTLPDELSRMTGVQVYPIHRLDRGTGGLMVYAKSQSAAARLSAVMNSGGFEKEYLAVVRGIPENAEGTMTDLLYHDRQKNKSFAVKKSRAGVKTAVLDYKVLATAIYKGEKLSLVQVRLHTGRTHQIRVQFSSRKLPLYGDGKYGGRTEAEGMALWAWSLKVRTVGEYRVLPPMGFPWALFEDNMPKAENT